MPSAWGHTRLLETGCRLITQESHCFSYGSVKSLGDSIWTTLALTMTRSSSTTWKVLASMSKFPNPFPT